MGVCRGAGNRDWISDMGLVWLIKYHFVPKRFGVVVPGHIYRSGQISAPLIKKILTKYNIRVIIDLTSADPNDPDKQAEKQAAAELNIKVLRFPMNGNGTGDVNYYANAVVAIANAEKQNLPVLVHCAAGAKEQAASSRYIACWYKKWTPISSKMKSKNTDAPSTTNRFFVHSSTTTWLRSQFGSNRPELSTKSPQRFRRYRGTNPFPETVKIKGGQLNEQGKNFIRSLFK